MLHFNSCFSKKFCLDWRECGLGALLKTREFMVKKYDTPGFRRHHDWFNTTIFTHYFQITVSWISIVLVADLTQRCPGLWPLKWIWHAEFAMNLTIPGTSSHTTGTCTKVPYLKWCATSTHAMFLPRLKSPFVMGCCDRFQIKRPCLCSNKLM
jgi:hypothetical protein